MTDIIIYEKLLISIWVQFLEGLFGGGHTGFEIFQMSTVQILRMDDYVGKFFE